MYRVITIAREYASGGAAVARRVARQLGWRLFDRSLLERIAGAAQVETSIAERYDECVDPWLHRLAKKAFGHGVLESVAAVTDADFFDSDAAAELSRRVILEAAAIGNCVLVGRGAQCVLRDRDDVFHVFIYASWENRLRRARTLVPDSRDYEALIRGCDRQRAAYVRRYFQEDWADPHLYDLLVKCGADEERAVQTILCAAKPPDEI